MLPEFARRTSASKCLSSYKGYFQRISHFLGPAYGWYPIKFILPEFVSYLGERGVLCVGNGSHFCTPVLMNMCNITFQVLRLSTFVFNKCSTKILKDLLCCWNNVGQASQTVAQHYISIGPMYRVILCSWPRDVKASPE